MRIKKCPVWAALSARVRIQLVSDKILRSSFAPASVESFSPADDDLPARLQVYFLGLFGPNGPLPFHLTEFAHERLHANRDPSLARFLDVFHHRMLSLFYRAWADSRKAVDLDRPTESRHSRYFGGFFGLGLPSMRDRDAVPDWAKLFFTGRLAAPNRNPEGLEAILAEDLGVPVKLTTFIGQWMDLPPGSLCSLGCKPGERAARPDHRGRKPALGWSL